MKFPYLKLITAAVCAGFMMTACSDNENDEPKPVQGKDMWGEVLRGDNMTLQFYPDHFAYYWEYTFDAAANPDLGLVITGEFPDARFMSYNVYNDDEQNSGDIENYSVQDNVMIADTGSENPFNTGVWKKGQKYTLYVLPTNAPESFITGKKNICWFDVNDKKVCTILRYYIPQGGITGSVPMPLVKAINVKTGKEMDAPKRELSGLRGEMEIPGGAWAQAQAMLFFRAPFAFAYPNGPAEYCYNRNVLPEDNVMFFNFKAPTYDANFADIAANKGDMRYWSVCVGNAATYTPLAICDYETKIDANGFANYVLADKNSQYYAKVKEIAENNNYNLLTWDGQAWGDGVMILYRNMLFPVDYEHSMRKLLPVGPGVDPTQNLPAYVAAMGLGQWGASGLNVPAVNFIGAQGQLPVPFRN